MTKVVSMRLDEEEIQEIEVYRSAAEAKLLAGTITKHSFMKSLLLRGLEHVRSVSDAAEGAVELVGACSKTRIAAAPLDNR